MTDAGCAGYSNWVTWNIALYMNNSPYYGMKVWFAQTLRHPATEEDARAFFERFMQGQCPDGFSELEGERAEDINFEELAEVLREEQNSD